MPRFPWQLKSTTWIQDLRAHLLHHNKYTNPQHGSTCTLGPADQVPAVSPSVPKVNRGRAPVIERVRGTNFPTLRQRGPNKQALIFFWVGSLALAGPAPGVAPLEAFGHFFFSALCWSPGDLALSLACRVGLWRRRGSLWRGRLRHSLFSVRFRVVILGSEIPCFCLAPFRSFLLSLALSDYPLSGNEQRVSVKHWPPFPAPWLRGQRARSAALRKRPRWPDKTTTWSQTSKVG